MARKITKKARLVSELAAIQQVQSEAPAWFKDHDRARLAQAFAAKSAELVSLEIAAYRRRFGR